MAKFPTILGIDIGSVAIAAAQIDTGGRLVNKAYCIHHGHAQERLKHLLRQFDLSHVTAIAATSSTPDTVKAAGRYDDRVAVMAAARKFYPHTRSTLIIGAEKFGLIQLDSQGNYHTFRANTGCAAGTGSFLDQQALRLKLPNTAALSALARDNTGAVAKIASRCAVFAKTDLVHAQQEGYRLEEICDGLCYGVAKNVVDVLFSGQHPLGPVLVTGGVAGNPAVISHIHKLIGLEVVVARLPCGAAGAALCLLGEEARQIRSGPVCVEDIIRTRVFQKTIGRAPIELELTLYPSFGNPWAYRDERLNPSNPVEVDVYEDLRPGGSRQVLLGLDIGSTSSKAVLMTDPGCVLAGFYTRTAGRPVKATQNLLAAIEGLAARRRIALKFTGAAATGSGRKFIGRIVGADLIIDEITAHAKAAVALHPEVDTIIEIGGQDSKFTTLQDGRVTFSAMNTVCAAGTGSFIEEQAQKLDCPLDQFSTRAEHQGSPLASDRCTVFMERDINAYLVKGYTVNEVLAAVLHSVVENYLCKVAIQSRIGQVIAFQGATAKNRALVAAMEQRLQKPLFVSRFCHLTGAMGAAMALAEREVPRTGFKGLALCKTNIPIHSEICELCANHCKITVANVAGELVAYGFLCGRDYHTRQRASAARSGFDLLGQRKKALQTDRPATGRRDVTFGLPAALHLVEDLWFWQQFFAFLGIRTITSAGYRDAVKEGKRTAGAEFCAPMMALCGHIQHLGKRCDYLFLPFYLEKRMPQKNVRRQYCYYTQFAPGAMAALPTSDGQAKVLKPLVHYLYYDFITKVRLHHMLNTQARQAIGFFDVSAAWQYALDCKQTSCRRLKEIYQHYLQTQKELHIVLLGRPYTVLTPSMNKGILDIFAAQGIKTFYQDMLTYTPDDIRAVQPLLAEIHWHYAAAIIEAAEVVARSQCAYPVLVTAFKCTPDSFVIDYFKKVMAAHDKPFLILQLDEHDSNVGYETRIEAAIAAFQGHYACKAQKRAPRYATSLYPSRAESLTGKTLLFPNWDALSQRLVVANLQKEGIDARLLQGSDETTRRSMRFNSGQCIPLNIIAQEFIDYIQLHNLDPGRAVLWICASKIACNIGLYPNHIQHIFNAYGRGFEKARVYTGSLSLADIAMKLPVNTYFAYMFGGLLKKMGCKIRPYEKIPGTTDGIVKESLKLLEKAFSGRLSKEAALDQVIGWFDAIERHGTDRTHPRPQVAIFGDLYVRDNELMNQDLIHFIEEQGGEVVTTPYSAYLKMIARPYLRKWFVEGHYLEALSSRALVATITHLEKTYYKYFQRILQEPEPVYITPPQEILSAYGLRIENTGESMENILKIHYLKKYHPNIALFVQASPAFCCAALITEAMAATIEKITQIPMVSVTYDGTGGNKNEIIIPYLKFPRLQTGNGNAAVKGNL